MFTGQMLLDKIYAFVGVFVWLNVNSILICWFNARSHSCNFMQTTGEYELPSTINLVLQTKRRTKCSSLP